MTCDLLGSQEVGLGAGAVDKDDAHAPVEVGGALEAVEGGERRLVDRVQLADDRVLAAGDETWVRAEVVQLERGLGPGLADQPCANQVPVVALAEQEGAVDEDERARLEFALSRATLGVARGHDATPTAVASGSRSKPKRSYACKSTRKYPGCGSHGSKVSAGCR